MVKRKKASDALKKLRSFVEDVSRHAELFRAKGPTYIDRFKMELHKGFAVFLTQQRVATDEFVKGRDLGIKKSVHINFAMVDKMLHALKTELRHFGPSLKPID